MLFARIDKGSLDADIHVMHRDLAREGIHPDV